MRLKTSGSGLHGAHLKPLDSLASLRNDVCSFLAVELNAHRFIYLLKPLTDRFHLISDSGIVVIGHTAMLRVV
jgi:hypothetical protein